MFLNGNCVFGAVGGGKGYKRFVCDSRLWIKPFATLEEALSCGNCNMNLYEYMIVKPEPFEYASSKSCDFDVIVTRDMLLILNWEFNLSCPITRDVPSKLSFGLTSIPTPIKTLL